MQLMGRLMGAPQAAVVAGDVRANENIALTAAHTLFAREHNRIVGLLPRNLPEETKFQIARRVVGAELQWITYEEFLPSLGVRLARYRGYNPNVDASLSNEFATVGYRAHSMVHGDIDAPAADGRYTQAQLDAFEQQGIDVETENGELNLDVPLNVAFGNPGLVPEIGLGPLLEGLAAKRQYRNDEQIDNQLRSVLFQVPGADVSDPSACHDGRDLPNCFRGVVDLGALDIARERDHGIPSYNALRRAYGLLPKRSFSAITGEASQSFPNDPKIDGSHAIDDPDILEFVRLLDRNGNEIQLGSEDADQEAVMGTRRTTVAARLKAIYGDVDKVDAFVGMLAERHVPGTEFGELQLAMWRRQFEALRDGDRFYYLNDPSLPVIRYLYGIDYRRSLAQLIVLNTDVHPGEIQRNVFRVPSSN
ncbi:MAG TPA: peroxidase family protein [Gaiellaceae bacterium]